MPVSNKFKVVAGSVSVAVALGAGTAIAGVGDEPEADTGIDLDDVVQVTEVDHAALPTVDASVAATLEALDDDSVGSPFDQDDLTQAETETVDDADTIESVDETDDTVESVDETDDTVESVDETDDTIESVDETNDTP